MNGEDKMIQITFKRQRKRRGLELLRLRRNEREMVELLWVGLGATTAGVLTELTKLHSPPSVPKKLT